MSEVYELLYFDSDRAERERVETLIAAHYGDRVHFDRCCDEIHGYRLGACISGESREGYFAFARQHGLVRRGLGTMLCAALGEDTE